MRTSNFPTLLTLTLLAAACTGSTERAASTGDVGGTIVVSMPEPATSLPPYIRGAQDRMLVDLIYERLAEMDTTMQTVGDKGFHPRLAKSWDWAADSLSIAFHVDPRARFHDGQPVRAEDVVFSFDLFKDPKVAPSVVPLLANIDSVTARDSLTAVAWFKKRTPEQFYDATYQVWIMPKHLLAQVPRDQLNSSEWARKPIGTNRFRLARWEPGTRVEIVADTGNYRGRAKLDRVIMTPAADFDANITRLMTGEADFFEQLSPQLVPRVDSSKSLKTVPYPAFAYAFMGMNQRNPKNLSQPHPIFGDRDLRRALSMGIDRQSMLTNVFGKLGSPAYGPFPKTVSVADTTLRMLPYDVNAAKATLDSLGWKPGPDGIRVKNGKPLAFSLLVPTSSRARMSYAVLLQEQFKTLGAKVELESIDFNAFLARKENSRFDAIMDAYGTDPSPSGAKQSWSSTSIGAGGGNALGYRNHQFDVLLDSAIGSFDMAKTKQYASRAFQQVIDDAPAIWLYDLLNIAGAHKRIQVTALRADGWWSSLPDWTIPASQRIDRDRIGLTAANR